MTETHWRFPCSSLIKKFVICDIFENVSKNNFGLQCSPVIKKCSPAPLVVLAGFLNFALHVSKSNFHVMKKLK